MTTDEPDLDWLQEIVEEVILLATDRKAEEICDRLETIGTRGGAAGMFSACYAWASAAGILSGLAETVERTHADGVGMMSLTGKPIDETAPDTFAARFLTCAVNGDVETAHALFDASWQSGNDERHQRDVIALVAMVGDFGRLKEAEVAEQRRQGRSA